MLLGSALVLGLLMAAGAASEPIRLQGLELDPSTARSSLLGLSRGDLERASAADRRTHVFVVHVTDIARMDGERLKQALGVSEVQYIPRNAFTFGGTFAQAAIARELEGVDWVSELTPEWKSTSFKKSAARAVVASSHGEQVSLIVMLVPPPSGTYSAEQLDLIQRDVSTALVDAGIVGASISSGTRRFGVDVSPEHVDTAVQAMSRVPEVSWVEPRMRVHALGIGSGMGGARIGGIRPAIAVDMAAAPASMDFPL